MTTHQQEMRSVEAVLPVPVAVLVARFVYVVFGVIASLITLRVMLQLFSANISNGFVQFIYDTSNAFVAPFHTVFNYAPTYGAAVFEIGSVFALLVYALAAWLLVAVVTIGSRRVGDA